MVELKMGLAADEEEEENPPFSAASSIYRLYLEMRSLASWKVI